MDSGGQPGNQNALKARRWTEALKRALSRHSGDIDKGLDEVAEQLVRFAVKGMPWAIEHLADRLEGKPKQTIESTVTVVDESRVADIREQLSKASSASRVQ